MYRARERANTVRCAANLRTLGQGMAIYVQQSRHYPAAYAQMFYAMSRGLRYVYTGNVHDEATQTTWCHGCGAALIGRDWHEITGWGLTDEFLRAGFAEPEWVDTEVEEIDVAAEIGGRKLFLPGFLLRTVRAFDT